MIGLDPSIHIGEALTILGVGWKIVTKLTRIASLLEDFPPHRHVNGKIVYPKDYSPGVIQQLGLT